MSTSNNGGSGNTNVSTLRGATRSNPVTVSLRVNIDVSGSVDIVVGTPNAVNNVVVCSQTAPVEAFYQDGSHGIIEYWEPSTARDTIVGVGLANQDLRTRVVMPENEETNIYLGLHNCLTNSLDASGAAPFNRYAGNSDYTTFASIGELALALHAEYLFGHVQATAAIDNDVTLVNYFNSTNQGDALLAYRLFGAIATLDNASATGIANQVIGQDPSRTAGADNSELSPDVHQALPFYAGDTLYVSITFKQPRLTTNVTDGVASTAGVATAMPGSAASAFPAAGAQLTFEIRLA
jgi:hypothetical protein